MNGDVKVLKKYKAKLMIKKSRHIDYFNKLDNNIQIDIIKRIDELIIEEKEYCDKGNYGHLCNILSAISLYELLQKHGKSEEESLNIVGEEMYKYIQKSKIKFQKMSKRIWFWGLMKKIIPIGFKIGSGYGWRFTWHNTNSKNKFKFEINECIYQKIFKKRHLEKLGPVFCKCDIINYGELNSIDFQRTKTLCYGDDECNFIFVKHKKGESFTRTKAK